MPYNPKNPADYENCLKKMGYSFQMNCLSDRIEYLGPGAKTFEPMTDGIEFKIRQLAMSQGLSKNNTSEVIRVLAEASKVHPIKDHLNSLQWDGNQNIEKLASFVTNPDGMFPLFLKKWMIGAIAKLFEGGKRNPVLVLDGPQLIGKSTFAQKLCWDRKYVKEGAIRPEVNDHELALSQIFLWEISELENTTSRSAVGALKDFLSRVNVTARLPYARYPLEKTAITSFIGTVNNMAGFLNDDSGSSRFRTTKITKIDFGYSDLDINQCWAEAMQYYRKGHTADLHPSDEARAQEINAAYEVPNPIVDAINQFFIVDPNDTVNYCTSFQIKYVLQDKDLGNLSGFEFTPQKMASALKKMGCEKKQKKLSGANVQVYYGLLPKLGVYLPSKP